MMTPVKHGTQQRRQDQQARAQSDHAIGHVCGEAVFHDQGNHARDHQQQGQAADAVAAAMMPVMMPMMMPVMMMVSVPMTTVSFAAALVAGFVERKFIAHPNINFAHSVSLFAAGFGRQGEYHQ
jgi:hypothetical protein